MFQDIWPGQITEKWEKSENSDSCSRYTSVKFPGYTYLVWFRSHARTRIWPETDNCKTEKARDVILICDISSWNIFIQTISWLYAVRFRSYGLGMNFYQESQFLFATQRHDAIYFFLSLITVSYTFLELWRGHEFWPRADNSKWKKARVVILVCDTLSWWDISFYEVSWLYLIRLRSCYGPDTNFNRRRKHTYKHTNKHTDMGKTTCPFQHSSKGEGVKIKKVVCSKFAWRFTGKCTVSVLHVSCMILVVIDNLVVCVNM